jgi:YVTN family beta-propeller protein
MTRRALGGKLRLCGILVASTLLLASCASARFVEPAPSDVPIASSLPSATPSDLVVVPQPTATPEIRLYDKIRVFVASESTDQVWVMEAKPDASFEMVTKIPVGRMPHQMAVSPDGKYVAVNNRMADSTSIIDPISMKEIVRIKVGKQPHGIAWAPDGKTLYIAHEKDNYIAALEAGTWKNTPLMVGVPQHVLTINPARPSELWFTVTNSVVTFHVSAQRS